jgi:hypothetical protein
MGRADICALSPTSKNDNAGEHGAAPEAAGRRRRNRDGTARLASILRRTRGVQPPEVRARHPRRDEPVCPRRLAICLGGVLRPRPQRSPRMTSSAASAVCPGILAGAGASESRLGPCAIGVQPMAQLPGANRPTGRSARLRCAIDRNGSQRSLASAPLALVRAGRGRGLRAQIVGAGCARPSLRRTVHRRDDPVCPLYGRAQRAPTRNPRLRVPRIRKIR